MRSVIGVQGILNCANGIGNVARAILGEVTDYTSLVVSNAVSVGIPLIAQCVTNALDTQHRRGNQLHRPDRHSVHTVRRRHSEPTPGFGGSGAESGGRS